MVCDGCLHTTSSKAMQQQPAVEKVFSFLNQLVSNKEQRNKKEGRYIEEISKTRIKILMALLIHASALWLHQFTLPSAFL